MSRDRWFLLICRRVHLVLLHCVVLRILKLCRWVVRFVVVVVISKIGCIAVVDIGVAIRCFHGGWRIIEIMRKIVVDKCNSFESRIGIFHVDIESTFLICDND